MNSRRDSPRFCVTAEGSDLLAEGGLRGARMRGIIPACTLFTVALPYFQPLPLSRARAPFSDADWLFEIKWDGCRSLLYSHADGVRLVSRDGSAVNLSYIATTSLGSDPVLRRLKDGDVIRPVSANASSVMALQERGLIRATEGRDLLTIVWRLSKK